MSTKPLKIISVTGAHSRVGKTTVCAILLKNLRGFGAIKFTKTYQKTEHRAQNTDAPDSPLFRKFGKGGFGSSPKTPNSSLIDDFNILNQKGKDTAIFLESGAEKVIWIRSPYHELENVLNTALSRMTGIEGVIIEGNSPVDFLNPHLIILIIDRDGAIKPSAINVCKKADIIIINSAKQTKNPPFLSTISRKGARVFWLDLLNRKGDIDEFLRFVKEETT